VKWFSFFFYSQIFLQLILDWRDFLKIYCIYTKRPTGFVPWGSRICCSSVPPLKTQHHLKKKKKKEKHLRSWASGGRDLFLFSAPEFDPLCVCLSPPRCLTCPLDLWDIQWVQRLVVVRVNWSGYTLRVIGKKRKEKKHGILKINGRRGHRVVCWRSPPLKVPNIL